MMKTALSAYSNQIFGARLSKHLTVLCLILLGFNFAIASGASIRCQKAFEGAGPKHQTGFTTREFVARPLAFWADLNDRRKASVLATSNRNQLSIKHEFSPVFEMIRNTIQKYRNIPDNFKYNAADWLGALRLVEEKIQKTIESDFTYQSCFELSDHFTRLSDFWAVANKAVTIPQVFSAELEAEIKGKFNRELNDPKSFLNQKVSSEKLLEFISSLKSNTHSELTEQVLVSIPSIYFGLPTNEELSTQPFNFTRAAPVFFTRVTSHIEYIDGRVTLPSVNYGHDIAHFLDQLRSEFSNLFDIQNINSSDSSEVRNTVMNALVQDFYLSPKQDLMKILADRQRKIDQLKNTLSELNRYKSIQNQTATRLIHFVFFQSTHEKLNQLTLENGFRDLKMIRVTLNRTSFKKELRFIKAYQNITDSELNQIVADAVVIAEQALEKVKF